MKIVSYFRFLQNIKILFLCKLDMYLYWAKVLVSANIF